MASFFQFLQANPYMLLFLTVGLAVWIGRFSDQGLRPRHGRRGDHRRLRRFRSGRRSMASSSSSNNFAKSLFYYLFMYGVGLRVGPSFINSLEGRRPQVHLPRRV